MRLCIIVLIILSGGEVNNLPFNAQSTVASFLILLSSKD